LVRQVRHYLGVGVFNLRIGKCPRKVVMVSHEVRASRPSTTGMGAAFKARLRKHLGVMRQISMVGHNLIGVCGAKRRGNLSLSITYSDERIHAREQLRHNPQSPLIFFGSRHTQGFYRDSSSPGPQANADHGDCRALRYGNCRILSQFVRKPTCISLYVALWINPDIDTAVRKAPDDKRSNTG
jgi:hypothetical protein